MLINTEIFLNKMAYLDLNYLDRKIICLGITNIKFIH